MAITSKKIGDLLYLVEMDGVSMATFHWIDASNAKPASAKHMDLSIFQTTLDRAFDTPDGIRNILLPIYSHVFHTVLEMTHDLSPKHVCKIYSDDAATKAVYSLFVAGLDKQRYTTKRYNNWIEIRKRAEISKPLL